MKRNKAIARKLRIRKKVRNSSLLPRLSVFRSNANIYAQVIDDKNKKTVVGVSEKHLSEKQIGKTAKAKEVGKLIAKQALAKKIKKVVFDRGQYAYHGRVKALAEGAREGGLEF